MFPPSLYHHQQYQRLHIRGNSSRYDDIGDEEAEIGDILPENSRHRAQGSRPANSSTSSHHDGADVPVDNSVRHNSMGMCLRKIKGGFEKVRIWWSRDDAAGKVMLLAPVVVTPVVFMIVYIPHWN